METKYSRVRKKNVAIFSSSGIWLRMWTDVSEERQFSYELQNAIYQNRQYSYLPLWKLQIQQKYFHLNPENLIKSSDKNI
jgi:hypothetical protein